MPIVHSPQPSFQNGSPLPSTKTLPPPSLLCMTLLSLDAEWMKTLSHPQSQRSNNRPWEMWVSLVGTKVGGRHQRRQSWAREDPCAQTYSGRWEHPPLPIYLIPPVCTHMHTRKHLPHPFSQGERRLRLRRWGYTAFLLQLIGSSKVGRSPSAWRVSLCAWDPLP